jgi:hypothetical protein
MGDFVKTRFPVAIYRGLIIDLEDRLRGEALKAHRMIQDHSGLDPRRARALEGLSRFHMMEKGFQEVCELHGGALLDGGIIPGTDFKVFQPFMRFEHEGQGFILGLAAMLEPSKLPVKNKSRKAGVTLNYRLSPHFDFDGTAPKVGDICIMFLFARDPEQAGKIKELAIGVIDSDYEQYLFYERIDQYLADDGDVSEPSSPFPTPPASPASGAVRLKRTIKTFVPPEAPSADDEEGGTA